MNAVSAPKGLEQAILDCLAARAPSATACPSEVARAVSPDSWRPLMPQVREAADKLVERGLLSVEQKGRQVVASSARGPIRLRLVPGAKPR